MPAPSVSESPDPVTVGNQYTIQGAGFDPADYLNVLVVDSHGTQVYIPGNCADGTFTLMGYTSWPGGYTIEVYPVEGIPHHPHPGKVLATGAFSVVP